MQRDIMRSLVEWKNSAYRKPLILKGARQVGKTWVLKELGRTEYRNCVYVTLEEIAPGVPSEYAQLFETTRDPKRIVANLSLAFGQPIDPGDTLLILDEIQDCPAAIGALKYFCDEAPEYHVACAGSLLEVRLSRDSAAFPVGKVEFLEMHPMTFSEYLRASGEQGLCEFVSQHAARAAESLASVSSTVADAEATRIAVEPVPDLFANQLKDHLKRYFSIGGMPEAVLRWTQTSDISEVDKVLSGLLDSYERDFAKHGGNGQFAKISMVWNSIPTQVARENKKFVWGLVRQGARAREYEDAVEWLVSAGLLHRVRQNSAKGIPMSAYDSASAFKVYSLDVGLLRRQSRLDASTFFDESRLFSEFKGAFAENFVLQSVLPQADVSPRYWSWDKPPHEVDFLIQVSNTVVPVEVKSGEAVKSASLRYFARKFEESTPLKVRMSLRNLSFDGDTLNIPLYMADHALSIIASAISRQR